MRDLVALAVAYAANLAPLVAVIPVCVLAAFYSA